jgi:hypothetical protein
MTDVFIPPEGAMQFEIIANGSHNTDALVSWEEARGLSVLWVLPPVPAIHCRIHKFCWPVIPESVPQRFALRILNDRRQIVVCECHGRIIE